MSRIRKISSGADSGIMVIDFKNIQSQGTNPPHWLPAAENFRLLLSPLHGHTPICFGNGATKWLCPLIKKLNPDRIFIITDENLQNLHLESFKKRLPAKIPAHAVVLPAGEDQKSFQNLGTICGRLFEQGATRSSLVIHFGGGVVLNIGGLAASLMFRGIRFIQVPTTLMAQSDVIVSNKQSVNFSGGKNRLGTFHCPDAVIVDPLWLQTEPERQIRAALVEYCKNALLLGGKHFKVAQELLKKPNYDQTFFDQIISQSLEQKFHIAKLDPGEKDSGLILEYGHTAGHALELLSEGKLLHGEAIYHGMTMAAQLAVTMGIMNEQAIVSQEHLLKMIGSVPPIPDFITPGRLLQAIANDNKRKSDGVHFVLLNDIGKWAKHNNNLLIPVPKTTLQKVFQTYFKSQS